MKIPMNIAAVVWREVLRRKDAYVLIILMGGLLAVLVSLDVFGLGMVTRYVLDVGLLLAWVIAWILAITVSARQVPGEESRGTIFSLLAKPVSRLDVIIGKWLGAWSVVSFAMLLLYLMVTALTLFKGGEVRWAALLQAALLHAAALAVICAIVLLVSCRMNADAAAAIGFIVTLASFLVLPRIPQLLTHESGVRSSVMMILYHALPHLEVFDMRQRVVHAYDPAPWSTALLVILYGALWCAMLLGGAWMLYRRRRFSRESHT